MAADERSPSLRYEDIPSSLLPPRRDELRVDPEEDRPDEERVAELPSPERDDERVAEPLLEPPDRDDERAELLLPEPEDDRADEPPSPERDDERVAELLLEPPERDDERTVPRLLDERDDDRPAELRSLEGDDERPAVPRLLDEREVPRAVLRLVERDDVRPSALRPRVVDVVPRTADPRALLLAPLPTLPLEEPPRVTPRTWWRSGSSVVSRP